MKLLLLLLVTFTTSVFAFSANVTTNSLYSNTVGILILAIIVVAAEVWIIRTTKYAWTPYSVIRLIGLTLIIFTTLFLAVDQSVDKDKLTQVIGLLAAIGGYLLGKDSKEQDSHSGK